MCKEKINKQHSKAETKLIDTIFYSREPKTILKQDMELTKQKSELYDLFHNLQRMIVIDACTLSADDNPIPIGIITNKNTKIPNTKAHKKVKKCYKYASKYLYEIAIDYNIWKENIDAFDSLSIEINKDIEALCTIRKLLDKTQKDRVIENMVWEELNAIAIYMENIDKYDCFLES